MTQQQTATASDSEPQPKAPAQAGMRPPRQASVEPDARRMKTLSRKATVYDAGGYAVRHGVKVYDHRDTIGIGATLHRKDELTITADRIVSVHGWEVAL